LREVLPLILFLRTLFCFYQDRALDNICLFIIFKAPCPDKNQPKVFGKGGMGERTFPQKGFSPIITRKLLYKHRSYRGFFIDQALLCKIKAADGLSAAFIMNTPLYIFSFNYYLFHRSLSFPSLREAPCTRQECTFSVQQHRQRL